MTRKDWDSEFLASKLRRQSSHYRKFHGHCMFIPKLAIMANIHTDYPNFSFRLMSGEKKKKACLNKIKLFA